MRDSQLIFLISLPRSGSTLLQRILGSHKAIKTASEPWLMLPLLSVFRKGASAADYNHELAVSGIDNFLEKARIQSGKSTESIYLDACRGFALELYATHQLSDNQFFLDKTPRYYLIFDELCRTFPNAKFIVLYRNPLAVFSSIVKTWGQNDLHNLSNYRVDLKRGIEFLQRDFSHLKNVLTVTFENLVNESEKEVQKIHGFLGLEADVTTVNYNLDDKWVFGDQRTVYENSRPKSSHASKWLEDSSDPEHRYLIFKYFRALGESVFEKLDYSTDHFIDYLTSSQNELSKSAQRGLDDAWRAAYGQDEMNDEGSSNASFLDLPLSNLYRKKNDSIEHELTDSRQKLEEKYKEVSGLQKSLELKGLNSLRVREDLEKKYKEIAELKAKNEYNKKKYKDQIGSLEEKLRAKYKQVSQLEATIEVIKNKYQSEC